MWKDKSVENAKSEEMQLEHPTWPVLQLAFISFAQIHTNTGKGERGEIFPGWKYSWKYCQLAAALNFNKQAAECSTLPCKCETQTQKLHKAVKYYLYT